MTRLLLLVLPSLTTLYHAPPSAPVFPSHCSLLFSPQGSPSISLTQLHASFQSDNPDFDRLVCGFRQQLHVQTLQDKLQRDNEQLESAIAHLKRQVHVQPCAADEEEHVHWQRQLEKFQSEFRALSLENLELKRVVSQQQVPPPPSPHAGPAPPAPPPLHS